MSESAPLSKTWTYWSSV